MTRRLRLAGLAFVAAVVAVLTLQVGSAQASVGGYGPIINSAGRGCVDVRTDDGANNFGAHIQNYHCTGSAEQQWMEQPVGNGFYHIVSKRSGLCLDGGGFWAVQWGCGNVPQQNWQQVWQAGFPSNAVQLRNGYGQCLELTAGNGADHQQLSVTTCASWYAQWWEIH